MDEYPADIRCSNAHWMLLRSKGSGKVGYYRRP